MSLLQVSEDIYRAMREHGEQAYPHECCGVLLGHAQNGANQAERLVRAGNTRTDSAHNRYSISPIELIRIQREGRAEGFDIVGFYHSHPDHPAQWSPTDFAEAHWLGCSYVITAVAQGRAEATNSFYLEGTSEDDKRFAQEPIEVAGADRAPDTALEPAGTRC